LFLFLFFFYFERGWGGGSFPVETPPDGNRTIFFFSSNLFGFFLPNPLTLRFPPFPISPYLLLHVGWLEGRLPAFDCMFVWSLFLAPVPLSFSLDLSFYFFFLSVFPADIRQRGAHTAFLPFLNVLSRHHMAPDFPHLTRSL